MCTYNFLRNFRIIISRRFLLRRVKKRNENIIPIEMHLFVPASTFSDSVSFSFLFPCSHFQRFCCYMPSKAIKKFKKRFICLALRSYTSIRSYISVIPEGENILRAIVSRCHVQPTYVAIVWDLSTFLTCLAWNSHAFSCLYFLLLLLLLLRLGWMNNICCCCCTPAAIKKRRGCSRKRRRPF